MPRPLILAAVLAACGQAPGQPHLEPDEAPCDEPTRVPHGWRCADGRTVTGWYIDSGAGWPGLWAQPHVRADAQLGLLRDGEAAFAAAWALADERWQHPTYSEANIAAALAVTYAADAAWLREHEPVGGW